MISDDSDDEFFDANDEVGAGDEPGRKQSIAELVPQGRLEQHPTLLLLKTGQALWIPITQVHKAI